MRISLEMKMITGYVCSAENALTAKIAVQIVGHTNLVYKKGNVLFDSTGVYF